MFAFRQATPDDAEEIARIVTVSTGGVVTHLLHGLVPGLDGSTLLASAFMKGEGPYTTENVILSEKNGETTALLFSYPAAEHAIPPLMASFVPERRLCAVRPILERSIPGSLYINTLWLNEGMQGKGLEETLLVEAASRCLQLGLNALSLFCWNDNEETLRLYSRRGFTMEEHLPQELIPLEGHDHGGALLCWRIQQS